MLVAVSVIITIISLILWLALIGYNAKNGENVCIQSSYMKIYMYMHQYMCTFMYMYVHPLILIVHPHI